MPSRKTTRRRAPRAIGRDMPADETMLDGAVPVDGGPQSVDDVLAERGARYGAFVGHAEVTQTLKRVISYQLALRKKTLADDQQETLDMICHKVGRIINGDPDYADSWVDIAGYAKLVSDRLQGLVR